MHQSEEKDDSPAEVTDGFINGYDQRMRDNDRESSGIMTRVSAVRSYYRARSCRLIDVWKEFTITDFHGLRNIIKYALLQTFSMMFMGAETFGKCQVLSFLYC